MTRCVLHIPARAILSVGLLVCLVGIGIVPYYCCCGNGKYSREERVAARIGILGGSVTWTRNESCLHKTRSECANQITAVDLVGYNPFDVRATKVVDDSLMKDIGSLTHLTSLRASLTSGQLHFLSGLRNLRQLNIIQEEHRKLDFSVLRELPSIEVLVLDNVDLCREDIAVIMALPKLHSLYVTSWNIDDPRLDLTAFRKRRPDVEVTTGAFTLGCD